MDAISILNELLCAESWLACRMVRKIPISLMMLMAVEQRIDSGMARNNGIVSLMEKR